MLRTVIQLLPSEPAVKQVTMDFETALWLAMKTVLPTVQIQGCVFHWTQALWRKVSYRDTHIVHVHKHKHNLYWFYHVTYAGPVLFLKVQELGLQVAYTSDDTVYRYIRKLMALPFLPHHEIPPLFQRLRLQAQAQPLRDLVNYIERQWIESTLFPPKDWSVYRQPVRTNRRLAPCT